jgi:hypothetical protein
VSPEERVAIEATARAFFDAWTSRRRKFKDCYDALLEGTEKKDKDLKEEARRKACEGLLHCFIAGLVLKN